MSRDAASASFVVPGTLLGPRPSAEGRLGVGHEAHGVGTGRTHPPVVLGRREPENRLKSRMTWDWS